MTELMEIKRSNLALPSSGYELEREEMSYVEGGGFTLYSWMVSSVVDIALTACGASVSFFGVKALGKVLGKSLATSLSSSIAPIVAQIIGSATGGIVNMAVGQLGQSILGSFWQFTSLGGVVGFVLDISFDGVADGVIYKW